jgi:CHAD domain-containing protein
VTRPGHVGGLRAQTPLRVAAEKLLHARVADVQGAQALTARRLDPKTVHDLRVACRRLRAAVKLFGKKRLRQLDGRIEHLQDALGELRDLQLEAKWLSRHGADARRTRGRLAKAEAHVRISVALWTRRSEPLVLRALIHRRASGMLGGRRTRKRLRKRLLDLEEKLAQPDPLDADAAHRIRIAAKKLRYEAELLRGAFDLADAIDLLTELQSALGGLHDADVRLATVRANPRLARAARAERRRSATQARRIVLRAKRLCPKLRRERL